MVIVLAQQPVGGEPQIVERRADAGEIIPGFRRQRQRAVLPDEQADPEFRLELPDLMDDRGLGDVQFGRRNGEAQMPGGGFERTQSIERGQSGGHFRGQRFMSLYHVKRHKVSFVESPNSADTVRNSLALGGRNVHLFTSIDDKSSWFWSFGADQRNLPYLARAAAPAA